MHLRVTPLSSESCGTVILTPLGHVHSLALMTGHNSSGSGVRESPWERCPNAGGKRSGWHALNGKALGAKSWTPVISEVSKNYTTSKGPSGGSTIT